MKSPLLEASRDYWDATAETYDQIFPETLIGRAQRNAVWRELACVFQSGQRILELNCGTGIDAVHLAEKGIEVLACDLSPRMIELATGRSIAANVAKMAVFRVMPTEDISELMTEGPFDGVLSNFSGLNCVEDLSLVARGLGNLLRPGAMAVFCMVGRIAPWEIAWHLVHGDAKKVMRRLHPVSDDPRIKAHYPRVRAIVQAFAPEFRLRHWRGIGVAVPPSCMEPLARRFPKILAYLARADQWLTSCPGVKGLADCVLLCFERVCLEATTRGADGELVNLRKQLRQSLAALAFGPRELSQFCNLGLRDPQPDIKVWLVGTGAPRDVTSRNVLAATRPLVVGIAFENDIEPSAISQKQLELEFREGSTAQTLLGKITLTFVDALRLEGAGVLCFFRTHNPVNYCQAKVILWRRYLDFAYSQWRNERGPHPPEIRMVASELHALFVFYICPRPVVLVSVVDGDAGSIFPMDLIGQIGRKHFSIALHTTSKPLPLIERSRRVALSSIPIEKMPLAYQLGKNHNRAAVDWRSLPFSITKSSSFGLPVPQFALRVMEIEVAELRHMGSHAFFICRLVKDYSLSDGLQFFQAHGLHEEWRKQAISPPAIH